jgi:hypothetical protein
LARPAFISTVIVMFAVARFADLSGFSLTGADAWARADLSLCTGARR